MIKLEVVVENNISYMVSKQYRKLYMSNDIYLYKIIYYQKYSKFSNESIIAREYGPAIMVFFSDL